MPPRPQPGDLVIGPLFIVNGKVLATESPAQYGYASYGHNGRFYKIALVVTMGSTVTVTIAAPARSQQRSPPVYGVLSPPAPRPAGLNQQHLQARLSQ